MCDPLVRQQSQVYLWIRRHVTGSSNFLGKPAVIHDSYSWDLMDGVVYQFLLFHGGIASHQYRRAGAVHPGNGS